MRYSNMPYFQLRPTLGCFLLVLLSGFSPHLIAVGQNLSAANSAYTNAEKRERPIEPFIDIELVRRALASNAELAAARLEVERMRARMLQARLRPNPTLNFDQANGRLVGNAGERATSVGFSLPLEVAGQRRRRIELAQAEFEAAQATVADRERRLANEVRVIYAEVLAATRDLEVIESINQLDRQTVRTIEARVDEGDAAPLEVNLLRVEIDRLRSRRSLIEGKLQATLLRLKLLAGMSLGDSLQVKGDLNHPALRVAPTSLETALEIALRTRPDLRLARLMEEAAEAGLKLAEAQSKPQIALSAQYASDRTIISLPAPLAPFPDRGQLLSFGASITLPLFNRNQGAKAEAATMIVQAQRRREFTEATIRAEVAAAYTRYQAVQTALATFEQGVIERSNDNIRAIRGAYDVGAFRVTELIAEQRRLLEAQRDFTEALAERYRALADLQSAMGIIEEIR